MTLFLRQSKVTSFTKEKDQTKRTSRRVLTDAIKEFILWAEFSGSKNANRYYANISKLIKTISGIEDRSKASIKELKFIELLESSAAGGLKKGVHLNKPYKEIYQDVRKRLLNLSKLKS